MTRRKRSGCWWSESSSIFDILKTIPFWFYTLEVNMTWSVFFLLPGHGNKWPKNKRNTNDADNTAPLWHIPRYFRGWITVLSVPQFENLPLYIIINNFWFSFWSWFYSFFRSWIPFYAKSYFFESTIFQNLFRNLAIFNIFRKTGQIRRNQCIKTVTLFFTQWWIFVIPIDDVIIM